MQANPQQDIPPERRLDPDLCRMVLSLRDVAHTIGFRVIYVKLVPCNTDSPSHSMPTLPQGSARNDKKMAALIHTAANHFICKGYALTSVDMQPVAARPRSTFEWWKMHVDVQHAPVNERRNGGESTEDLDSREPVP